MQTERPIYHSGDLVNGTIFVNVATSFDCTGLELHVCLIFDVVVKQVVVKAVKGQSGKIIELNRFPRRFKEYHAHDDRSAAVNTPTTQQHIAQARGKTDTPQLAIITATTCFSMSR